MVMAQITTEAGRRIALYLALGVLLAFLAGVGGILYLYSANAKLRLENASLAAQQAKLNTALPQVSKAAQAAREAHQRGRDAIAAPDVADWRDAPLPPGVRDALRRSPE
jgi:Tfp pilus assembly protein PilN